MGRRTTAVRRHRPPKARPELCPESPPRRLWRHRRADLANVPLIAPWLRRPRGIAAAAGAIAVQISQTFRSWALRSTTSLGTAWTAAGCGRWIGWTARSRWSTRRHCPASTGCCASTACPTWWPPSSGCRYGAPPAIGVAGAFGVALAVRAHGPSGPAFDEAVVALREARPTAVNLARMVDRAAATATAASTPSWPRPKPSVTRSWPHRWPWAPSAPTSCSTWSEPR